MYALREAVARFFPAGRGYDTKRAELLIEWLDHCGYEVVAKDRVTKPLPDSLRIEALAAMHRKSA